MYMCMCVCVCTFIYIQVKRIKEDHGQVLFGLAVNLYDERWKVHTHTHT